MATSTGATATGPDSTLVFIASVEGASARLTTRFREGRLRHAFLTVQGDSAALQRILNRYATSTSARHGQPRSSQPRHAELQSPQPSSRQPRARWVLRDGRAFTLPRTPTRLEDGTFGFGVSFHGR